VATEPPSHSDRDKHGASLASTVSVVQISTCHKGAKSHSGFVNPLLTNTDKRFPGMNFFFIDPFYLIAEYQLAYDSEKICRLLKALKAQSLLYKIAGKASFNPDSVRIET
jgi:hypothetical protein